MICELFFVVNTNICLQLIENFNMLHIIIFFELKSHKSFFLTLLVYYFFKDKIKFNL